MANLQKIDKFQLSPPYDGTNLTNRALITEINKKDSPKEKIYYVPAYMRSKVKNIIGMDLTNLSAQINAVVLLAINVKDLPPLIRIILKSHCELSFNRDKPEKLNSNNNKNVVLKDKKNGKLQFTVRHQFTVGMKAHVTRSPFELIQLILSVQLEQIILDADEVKAIIDKLSPQKNIQNKEKFSLKIKFNLMDTLDKKAKYTKLSSSDEGTFGNYDIAQKKLSVEYTNDELCSILKQKKQIQLDKQTQSQNLEQEIKQFDYAHFIIPLYKFPLVSMCTIFMPLIFLGILSLSVFFTDPGLADRVGSISALMMTFVALIQVIQEQLPPCRQITYSEWCVYLSTLINILCLAQSLSIRNEEETYVFVFYQNWMFILSCITQVILLLFIIVGLLVDKFKLRKDYNEDVKVVKKLEDNSWQSWSNYKCDDHFRKKIDTKEIKILANQDSNK